MRWGDGTPHTPQALGVPRLCSALRHGVTSCLLFAEFKELEVRQGSAAELPKIINWGVCLAAVGLCRDAWDGGSQRRPGTSTSGEDSEKQN